MKTAALVAAAGAGLRMNTTKRKQYIILEEKPVLARSLNLFVNHPAVTEIIAVIPPGDTDVVIKLLKPFCPMERIRLVEGGNTRQESVSRGLRVVSSNVELICIHDAARPLASTRLLDRLIEAAHRCDAAVPVVALTDTVKEVSEEGFVLLTPERERLRLVQTPQVFKRQLIIDAYEEAARSKVIATDDASLVELLGKQVKAVPGETVNLKITSSLDLLIASLLLKGAGNN
jgi:2-C-methyl-D-erythritol 4-phosphate cytidylyltransferase